ncbi:MAG: HypC/HybG/HupF family hydrogenase formation chaperone [Heliobacteriaceae bacterium]|nr:HypC/HybG/HupF family hydrogenase formation chaperone [Heliobacteriaceae bacterium]MDD4587077.1 HypC/HybG/HupF family hydrogenase formation chaperone [Heliobacteriaceae bacterium]
MCLAVPGKVIALDAKQQWAELESFGFSRKVGTQLIDHVEIGDYLIVHAGFAIEKLDLEEAQERLRLWEELLAAERGARTESGSPNE